MARPRTYLLNEKYFDIIDSEKKAYILGFIYADGSVCRTTLNISLSEKDIEILHDANYGITWDDLEIYYRKYGKYEK